MDRESCPRQFGAPPFSCLEMSLGDLFMDLPSSVCTTPKERFESAEDVEEWIWSLEDCGMRDALLSFVQGEHLEGAEWLASFMYDEASGSAEEKEGLCGSSSSGCSQQRDQWTGGVSSEMPGNLSHHNKEHKALTIRMDGPWGPGNRGGFAGFDPDFFSCLESTSTRSTPSSSGGQDGGNDQKDRHQYSTDVSIQNNPTQNSNSMQNNHNDDTAVEECLPMGIENQQRGRANMASDDKYSWSNDVRCSQSPSSKWWQDGAVYRSSPACSIESS